MALIHLSEAGFQRALQAGYPMMVVFWATWCGPCKMLSPIMEQIAEDYEGKPILIGKVDVDSEEKLAHRYGVMSFTIVIFCQDGREMDRKVGATPMEAYVAVLDGMTGGV